MFIFWEFLKDRLLFFSHNLQYIHVSFFANIQIHIAFQSMFAHIAIKHKIYIIFCDLADGFETTTDIMIL